MKKQINRLIDFFELRIDKSLFEINHSEIQKANLQFLRQIALLGAVIAALLCCATYIIPFFAGKTMAFFALFVISAIIFGVTCIIFNSLLEYSSYLIYFYLAVIMAFCAVLDVYYGAESLGVIFPVFLALIPISIMDNPTHVFSFTILLWAAYCVASVIMKDHEFSQIDVISSTVAMLTGITVGTRILKSRVSNLNSTRILLRQIEIDSLTGLPNYKKLMQDLSGENDTRVAMSLCGMAIIDIDNFKEYNTKYGREMGDKALKKIGGCMQRISDPTEIIIYRYGGTSLVAVSLIHDYKGIQRVCQGISSIIRGLDIEFKGAPLGKITVSCGFVDVVECECDEYGKMLEMAQEALQQAQAEGGNTYIGYMQLKAMKERK